MTDDCKAFLRHIKQIQPFSAVEIYKDISIIPKKPGIYAWYFKFISDIVPISDCHEIEGLRLLYIGVAPRSLESNSSLQQRIKIHLMGIAEFSTLRYSLGCLLRNRLNIELFLNEKGHMTFGIGESRLSSWIYANASVVWLDFPEPWKIENQLFTEISLPLNIQHNNHHPFSKTLSKIRSDMKKNIKKC